MGACKKSWKLNKGLINGKSVLSLEWKSAVTLEWDILIYECVNIVDHQDHLFDLARLFQGHPKSEKQVTVTYISMNLTKMCLIFEVTNKTHTSFSKVCTFGWSIFTILFLPKWLKSSCNIPLCSKPVLLTTADVLSKSSSTLAWMCTQVMFSSQSLTLDQCPLLFV